MSLSTNHTGYSDVAPPPPPPPPKLEGGGPAAHVYSMPNGYDGQRGPQGGAPGGYANGYPKAGSKPYPENGEQEDDGTTIILDDGRDDYDPNIRNSELLEVHDHAIARSGNAKPAPRIDVPLPPTPNDPSYTPSGGMPPGPPSSTLPPPLHYKDQRQEPRLGVEPKLKVRGTVLQKHIPLAKCRVLYLGSATPGKSDNGLHAMQPALRERYRIDQEGEMAGVDAWVTAFSTGLQMVYAADSKMSAWFPIQSLCICAATRCVIAVNGATGESVANFEPIDSDWSKRSSHPPIFSAIMHSNDKPDSFECHIFICKSETAAMALVQSCTHAFEHREGWASGPPPSDDEEENKPPQRPTYTPAKREGKPLGAEFYQNPPPQGYFYTSKKELVKKHKIFTGDSGRAHSLPPTMERRMVPVETMRTVQPAPQPFNTMGPMMMRQPRPMMRPPPMTMRARMAPPPGPPRMPPPRPFMMRPPGPMYPGPVPPPYFMYPAPPPPGAIMMPAPPPDYFSDWNQYSGQPVAIMGYPGTSKTKKKHKDKDKDRGDSKSRERSKSSSKHRSKSNHESRHRHDDNHHHDNHHHDKHHHEKHHHDRHHHDKHHDKHHSDKSRSKSRPHRRSPSPRRKYSDYSSESYSSDESYEERTQKRYAKKHQSASPQRRYKSRHDSAFQSRDRRQRDYDYSDDYAKEDYDYNYQDRHDQRRRSPDHEERRHRPPSPDLYHDPQDDLEIFVDRYQSQPRNIEYESNFSPEIILKAGNKDLMKEEPPADRRGEAPRPPRPQQQDKKRLPRNDHGFGRSIKEERRILGDNYRPPPNPYQINDYSHQIEENDMGYGYSQKIERMDKSVDRYGKRK